MGHKTLVPKCLGSSMVTCEIVACYMNSQAMLDFVCCMHDKKFNVLQGCKMQLYSRA